MSILLNEGYTEKIIWNPKKEEARGVLARIWFHDKRIEYYPRWWLIPIWFLIFPFIRRHERGHSWGIKECLSSSKTCVMYEDDDTWLGKMKLLPIQIFGLGRLCRWCNDYINKAYYL